MGIAKFIRDHIFSLRLKKAECLVVYDPDQRYRDLCLEIATEEIMVVDAVESSIESREKAQQAFHKLGAGTLLVLTGSVDCFMNCYPGSKT